MSTPLVRRVLACLDNAAMEARFVGGCVRDALLGKAITDVDLATPAVPEQVLQLFNEAGLKPFAPGLSHGTVSVAREGFTIEVTTLRHDVETDGRHAKVAFTDDWRRDAARRDFTINAMSCTAQGKVFDYFGGLVDLESGRVRFVGNARDRIQEDYLRLLRFFRFHAHYGRGDLDADGLAAAHALAPQIAQLSGERVRSEVLRLLEAPDPVPVLAVMHGHRIFTAILPQLGATETLVVLLEVAPDADGLARLAALVQGGRPAARRLADRLRLSRAQTHRLVEMIALAGEKGALMESTARRWALYKYGAAVVEDRLRLDFARSSAAGEDLDRDILAVALAEARGWQAKHFPLSGQDVKQLGVSEGPEVGRLLRQVESWWVAENFEPDREACLDRLSQLAKS